MKELKAKIELHQKWLNDDGGEKLILIDHNLRRADLRRANLYGADLRRADLSRANLRGADLRGADLRRANLYGADLSEADLSGADLSEADLSEADLSGADLRRANLYGADIEGTRLPHFQIPEGDIIGWGKKGGIIVKLLIPASAKRTGTPMGRKCRAEFAKVLEVDCESKQTTSNYYGNDTIYKEGEMAYPDKYDGDVRVECTSGIHFFLTRAEAEEWQT